MVLKITATGATGKMGQAVIAEIKTNKDLVLQQEIANTNILIDFSLPAGTMSYLSQCLAYKIPMVIGTTGFTQEQLQLIQQAALKIPILISPNMSIGINLSFILVETLAKLLAPSTLITITDRHHKEKRDLPSGTALKFLDLLQQSAPQLKENITCNSLREDQVVGEHSLLFNLENESIEIVHKAIDRSIYATGAIKAAQWLYDKPIGLYTMRDLIN